MCVMSMIGDQYQDSFPERWPHVAPQFIPATPLPGAVVDLRRFATAEDVAKLRREVEALRDALLAAGKLDELTGQKNCTSEEKVALIRRLAEALGVDLRDALKPLEAPGAAP